MRRQGGRLALVGLGALSLACATAKPPAAPPPRTDVGEAVPAQLQSSAEELARQLSACTALGAKVSEQEESTLGAALAASWGRGGGPMLSEHLDEELQRYLDVLGQGLAARSSRPTLAWTFGVLQEPHVVNATSAPGGYVFVTRGLLQAVENEAQLAGVLAHEMAHVTLQHVLLRYGEVKVTQCRMAVGIQVMRGHMRQLGGATPPPGELADVVESLEHSGALESDKPQDLLVALTDKMVERLLEEGYTQRDEYAADEEAVRLLVSAGYDPQEYIRLLGRLPDVKERYAHHPSRETRQRNLRYLLADALKDAGTPELRRPALPPVFSRLKAAP